MTEKINPSLVPDPSLSGDELESIRSLPEMQNIAKQIDKINNSMSAEDQKSFPEVEDEEVDEVQETQEETLPEEENEALKEEAENLEEEPIIEQKKEVKAWKEKKKRYQAEAKVRQLEAEKEDLMRQLTESLNSGTYHYSRSAYADLERAKEQKKQALESGNVNEAIEADVALAKAVNTINEIEKWVYDSKINPQPNVSRKEEYTAQQPAIPIEEQDEMVREWLEYHPYLDVNSTKYNKSLAVRVATFVNQLDANLAKNGQENMFYSPEYFETVDDYIEKARSELMKPKNVQSVSNVAGVRNSYASTTGKPIKKNQMTLSPMEKMLAANFNLTQEQYLMAKINNNKNR
jgi:hypothetical protein